jgi:uncharacterized protein (DUF342 family)
MVIGDSLDGHIEITISEDGLEAWADLYPPAPAGRPITSDYLSYEIADKNIHYGLQMDELEQKALICNTSGQEVRHVVFARGVPPVDQVDEYYDLAPRFKDKQPLATPNKGSGTWGEKAIDYKAISPFQLVKKGEILAYYKPPIKGKEGMDVYGMPINYRVLTRNTVKPSTNTRVENRETGRVIAALISGQFLRLGDELAIDSDLNIKGQVGYATGHINFPGNVSIAGEIAAGFKIYAGGNVTIKQTLDLTDVVTGGDLSVMGGIIGRSPGLVKVGGILRTKFIENCRVACRKQVVVQADIVNSSIFSLQSVVMSEKGGILGGDIWAVHGIRTGNIGKNSNKTTRIHCGIDFTVQQEKDKSNNELRLVNEKIRKYQEILHPGPTAKRPDGETVKKINSALKELEAEQAELSAKLEAYMKRVYADEKAVVEIIGELAADTLIEICDVSLYVKEPLRKVRIRLDRNIGELVSETLNT